ncbi:hypothetical protein Mhypo_02752 [Meiothermus hypogaeus]|uniref:Uncharacterized protein n=1 Tax=Meiothermus hypogaeus TaxID=884155 RepID=A0ABX9MN50_9DEIN|nr:hypothetical protein Mhypo_02752 [Meiothermus hypogaeus]
MADVRVHQVGPYGTVDPDHIYRQALQHGQGGAVIGADQQGAGGLERYLHLQRHLATSVLHGLPGGQHRAAYLQDVLAGLDDEQIHPALYEAPGPGAVGLEHFTPANLSQRDELGARPQRPRHKARLFARVRLGGLPGDLGGGKGQVFGLGLQAVLGKHVGQAAKGVGLNYVRADLEVAAVYRTDYIRAGAVQNFRTTAILLTPIIRVAQVVLENFRAHGPVVDQHPLRKGFQIRESLYPGGPLVALGGQRFDTLLGKEVTRCTHTHKGYCRAWYTKAKGGGCLAQAHSG